MERITRNIPKETGRKVTKAGVFKAAMPFTELAIKSFMGGAFVAFGSLFDLVVTGGLPGIRQNNPSISTLLGGFVFPIGFVLVILAECELFNSNLMVMVWTFFQRKITYIDLGKSIAVSYVLNLAGSLFVAGFLCWWANVLSTMEEQGYAVAQAEARVNAAWSTNFLKGVGCNWLVGLAAWLSFQATDQLSKIYSIWIPICAFIVLGYQHAVANFSLIPIGMFYKANFGIGKFIVRSVIPVTLGNIIGGIICALSFWCLYGRPTAEDEEMEKKEFMEELV